MSSISNNLSNNSGISPTEQLRHLSQLLGHLSRLTVHASSQEQPLSEDQISKINAQWGKLVAGVVEAHAKLPQDIQQKLHQQTVSVFNTTVGWNILLKEADGPISLKKKEKRLGLMRSCIQNIEPKKESNTSLEGPTTSLKRKIPMTRRDDRPSQRMKAERQHPSLPQVQQPSAPVQHTQTTTTTTAPLPQVQQPSAPVRHTQTTSTAYPLNYTYPTQSHLQAQQPSAPVQFTQTTSTAYPLNYTYPTQSHLQAQQPSAPVQFTQTTSTAYPQNYTHPMPFFTHAQQPSAPVQYPQMANTVSHDPISLLWETGQVGAALDGIFAQQNRSIFSSLAPLSPEQTAMVMQYLITKISSGTPLSEPMLYLLISHLHRNQLLLPEHIDCILEIYEHPNLSNSCPHIIRLLFSSATELTSRQMDGAFQLLKNMELGGTIEQDYVEALQTLCLYVLEEGQINTILYDLIPKLPGKKHPLKPLALFALLTQHFLTNLQKQRFSLLCAQLSSEQQRELAAALQEELLRQPKQFPEWVPRWILDLEEDKNI